MSKRSAVSQHDVQIIEALPPDAFAMLVNHALLLDVTPLRLTCKRWNALVGVVCDEQFWRSACDRAFPRLIKPNTVLSDWAPSWKDLWDYAWGLVLRYRFDLCIPALYPSRCSRHLRCTVVKDDTSTVLKKYDRSECTPIETLCSQPLMYVNTQFVCGKHVDKEVRIFWCTPASVEADVIVTPYDVVEYSPYDSEKHINVGKTLLTITNASGQVFWEAQSRIQQRDSLSLSEFRTMHRQTTHIVKSTACIHPQHLDEHVFNRFCPKVTYMARSRPNDN